MDNQGNAGASIPGTELVASREFQKALAKPKTIEAIQVTANFASSRLGDPAGSESVEDVDEQLRDGSLLGNEHQEAIDELNALFARYSNVPIRSVAGMVKLHDLVVASYKATRLVPAQTRAELTRIEQDLAAVYESRNSYIDRRLKEAERRRKEAELQLIEAQRQVAEADLSQKLDQIRRDPRLSEAETQAAEQVYGSDLRKEFLGNAASLLHKTVDNDRLEKTIEVHKRSLSIMWKNLVRPILRPILKWTIILLLVLVPFTYFVETSRMEMYPPLIPFNGIRHLIFDPIAGTIGTWGGKSGSW